LYRELFGEDVLIKNPEGQKRKINSYCGLGENFFYLGCDGSVSLCPMLNFGRYVVGNIRKRSIRDKWETSQLFNYFRQRNHIKNSRCEGCQKIDVCAGGCKAKSLFFNGSLTAPDPWMCSYFFRH
jgi:radical SAM protein with 4Fe4S-binding SPASM domain